MKAVDLSGILPPASTVRALPGGDDVLREPTRRAVEASIVGVVQGVGFRPFVHRLALKHGIAGWVRNESGAVRVRAEGSVSALRAFLADLRDQVPPLARIDGFHVEGVASAGLRSFQVVRSDTTSGGRLPVSPDVAVCDACVRELRDPANPRFGYPFITCTDCGPRFTVIEEMPYDRVRTTMRVFRQCPSCSAEYEAPADRRYHSETNSCPVCGPRVWLELGTETDELGTRMDGPEGIEEAGRILGEGGIVALRGLGGFHLACRADDEEAVARLRRRKARDAKPLAIMVADLAAARRIAVVSALEARHLTAPERPIVVLKRRDDARLAPGVSPGLDSVGVMLAYTPLHLLLLDELPEIPLVMTSGNVSEEPIAIGNGEARERLRGIADGFLLHDREIVARYDDSVLRVDREGPVMMRRSRGYAPMPLRLPVEVSEAVLAVGPHLKNTFTLAQGSDAFVSQHIGDLETLETHAHFQEARRRFEALFHMEPRWVVRDLHPGYMSTAIAESSGLEPLPPVQHHHAHVAAVAAEHGVVDPVLGLAFDGTGYGADGRVWGCEILVADLVDFRRLGHLRYAPLPGGDLAARSPWRTLLGYASLDDDPSWADPVLHQVDGGARDIATRQIARSLNAPMASSLGRLFDAAAALLGIRTESLYEGQAAMELEAAAGVLPGRRLPFPLLAGDDGKPEVLDPVPLLRALAEGRIEGRAIPDLAADFHESVAAATTDLAVGLAAREGLDTVALGGGCFQNARLSRAIDEKLSAEGLRVLFPRLLSPNDGSVSFGQAAVAAARLGEGAVPAEPGHETTPRRQP
ncbi:MAG: carbamoyltransferase HypF [Longimicrobiales bacterium]|nr:carbamoyltransferase HypF [Longimicrobiales bacterium]